MSLAGLLLAQIDDMLGAGVASALPNCETRHTGVYKYYQQRSTASMTVLTWERITVGEFDRALVGADRLSVESQLCARGRK